MSEPIKTPSANTFVVNIRYRRNGTWQGTVSWMNGKKSSEFRSALEMMKLMEEAMDATVGDEQIFDNK